MKTPRHIALVINEAKPHAGSVAAQLRATAERAGVTVTTTTANPVAASWLKGADLCGVIGGDGTILSVVHAAVAHQVPVFGVNLGKLGFLATFAEEEAGQRLEALLRGEYRVAHRALLRCASCRGETHLALNDVVVRHHSTRLLQLRLKAGEEAINNYSCDGMIIATATGSTAYNLSANGPLVHPEARVTAITPICPHTLSNRTVILRAETTLEVGVDDADGDVIVTIDGRERYHNPEDFPLCIDTAKETFPLVQALDYDYFALVRNKLHWT